jgi:dynein heavy chain
VRISSALLLQNNVAMLTSTLSFALVMRARLLQAESALNLPADKSRMWSQPTPELAAGGEEEGAKIQVPAPRGGHTVSLVGDNMYVFGGYGGAGFGRRDFNDLHTLNTETFKWQQVTTHGEMPEARSDHKACVVKDQIFISGGWNASHQLADVWILDTTSSTWSQPECPLESPLWSHVAVGVWAVPDWKVFVFGGESGDLEEMAEPQGTYMNQVRVLDTGNFTWAAPSLVGAAPLARADTDMVFDSDKLQMICFGGWANQWLDDLHVLDVSEIVGPPYNLVSIETPLASPPSDATVIMPVTGDILCTVTGQNFQDYVGKQATVRFACSKGFVDVNGDCLSDTSMTCLSPNFEKYGPVEVEVRVSLGNKSMTNFACNTKFHAVTNAPASVAFGPGLLAGNSLEKESTFIIQAMDLPREGEETKKRNTGGDEFKVVITAGDDVEPDQIEEFDEEGEPTGKMLDVGPAVEDVKIIDRQDGTYAVNYAVPKKGTYNITVEFMGTFAGLAGPIRGSPFNATFHPVPTAEEIAADTGKKRKTAADNITNDNNKMDGPLMMQYIEAQANALEVKMKNTMKKLTKKVAPGNRAELQTVKQTLKLVESEHADQAYTVDTCTSALEFLKDAYPKHAREVEKAMKDLTKAEGTWQNVATQVPKTTEAIVSETASQGQLTQNEIKEYEKQLGARQKEFRQLPFWEAEAGLDGEAKEWHAHNVAKAAELMDEQKVFQVSERQTLQEKLNLCQIFDFPKLIVPCQTIVDDIDAELQKMEGVWAVIDRVQKFVVGAQESLWSEVLNKLEDLEDQGKTLTKAVKDCDRAVRDSGSYKYVDAEMKNFQTTIPLIMQLGAPSMQIRHWKQLGVATHKEFKAPPEDPQLKLGGLLELQLHEYAADVEEICDQAGKEDKMEKSLVKLKDFWSDKGSGDGVKWFVEMYKGTDVPLLKMDDEAFESLEADQLAVQGMMASRYIKQFEEEVKQWFMELGMTSEVCQMLGEIQRTWSYLEPLFIGSEEVKKELPETAERFKDIDIDVKKILRDAHEKQIILYACNKEGLLTTLEALQEQLELCRKSLNEFLDGRCRQFPRFYFMSEADLLDVLSNGSQPIKIMQHVSKIYLATKGLHLTEVPAGQRPSTDKWIAGVGAEEVPFSEPVKLEGKVESYLQTVGDAMRSSMFKELVRSLKNYQKMSRIDWLMNGGAVPEDMAQVSLLVAGVNYGDDLEFKVFPGIQKGNQNGMKEYNAEQIKELGELISTTRTKLEKGQRMRVMCMITLDAHQRDIVAKMNLMKVEAADHFMWMSQLKLRFCQPQKGFLSRDPNLRDEMGKRAECKICDAVLPYDYEYLGNGPRLVVTPLTDRIYVTATQALNLKMGCAPAGPAGTGKTESTKDLASALGKVCYVFNCSPEMDYRSMGNIYKGLASSGAWGCFDEFNRLVPEVLSVCTVQFKAVCDGCKADATRIVVEGDEISLDPTTGAFITMNPGYLGRSELPEGLKALFRPMTVMVPDLVLICENMLMAEGFELAKELASKFYGLYSLLKELLSKQLHYDWGLRAVKSVLVVAGAFKRAEPDVAEAAILMRALRDFNTPKIVAEDAVIFFGLLADLFPGIDPPRAVDEELEDLISKACGVVNNNPDEVFHLKVVQLNELIAIRHCVFVMGPAGAGKSQVWRTLATARGLRGPEHRTKFFDLNPKSISTKELYGYITMATREWRDGLLSKIMRDVGQIPDEKPKWILLDGDLDANWIESMNSVMDDNRMLTLASNERIPLKPHMRLIFEIRDLKHATPATTSRAGILYISADGGSQWRSLVKSWLNAREEDSAEVKQYMQGIFDTYCKEAIGFIQKFCKPVVPVEDITMIQTLLDMLNTQLSAVNLKGAPASWQEPVETIFIFCSVWAFGGMLALSDDGTDYPKLFSDWWRNEWKKVKFPTRETVFDYWLNPKDFKFEPWGKSPYFYSIEYDSETMPMATVTVPTSETCSVSFWLENLVANRRPVMMCGGAGTGKTQMVMGMLQKQDPTQVVSATINFNFFTSGIVLQNTMELPLQKKTGSNYGPPGTCRLIYFVDDINLPEMDAYMTQDAIALLRQHMEYEHVYDRNKLSLKNIADTQMVACMNPTAGSFLVNPRLQRRFATFAVGMPGPTSLLTIYQTFLNGHLRPWKEEFQNIATNIIKSALGLHNQISATFRKTAANFHYEFNIRHLSNVFQGLLTSQKENFAEPQKFVELWLHESERVYGDRLVSPKHLLQYRALAQGQSKKQFPNYNVAKFFAAENADPLIFCHFCQNIQDKMYDQVTSVETLAVILDGALREHNETNAAMPLVLFEDAMKHVCRVVRIVLNEGGHALLVGVGGSGKQSLSRLAAYICGFTVKQIVISGNYGIADLKEDLKWMYNRAGMKDEGVMFLMTDSQITQERFLIYLNDLLASGNIPDLFAIDEQDGIVGNLTSRCKSLGLSQERAAVWAFFISEVRKNLHCSLCFSPVGDDFRIRASRFPALVNCTVIDWFQPWPKEALHSVGKFSLAEVDLGVDAVHDGVVNFMPASFETVNNFAETFLEQDRRYVYTTPKSYLELLKLYVTLLASKRAASTEAIDRLDNGLKKLKETGDAVAQLEEDLKESLVVAEEKKTTAEGIAEQVTKEKAIVEVEVAKADVENKAAAEVQEAVSIKKRDTEADLERAEPAVKDAMAALNTLNKKDLGECKGMTKPPGGVDDVFSAVMVLLAGVMPSIVVQKNGKVKDRGWDQAKKQMLGNIAEFLDQLMGFKEVADAGNVPAVNWKEVRPYIELEHFDVEIIKKKNGSAAGLVSWVVNIVIYYDIVTTVEPKRLALKEAMEQLEVANETVARVTALVNELQAKLDKLIAELNAATKEKQDALDTVEKGHKKLDLAQRLTAALGSENVRWQANVIVMKSDSSLLVGDVLLASAFLSYIGPFTKPFRDLLLYDTWVPYLRIAAGGETVPMSEKADPIAIMADAAVIAKWNSQGLPTDAVSTENGAIVVTSARWPLLIDPQLQGIAWVRDMEGTPERNLQIVRLGQSDLMRKMEAAIERGNSVLIENMGEKVDAVLNPVIQRLKTKKGHKFYVKLGDSEVEFHPDFRLFLHTKLSNPHYPPEIQAECTLVNFTVTILGLEDQILDLVVGVERADLAAKSIELIKKQNEFKIQMIGLENDILGKLAAAEGDITEDVALIEGLEEAKRISNDISKQVEEGRATQANIGITSEKYRSVAARAALIFFLMNDLSQVHTYYIYSLAAFTKVFYRGCASVTEAPAAPEAKEDGDGEADAEAAEAAEEEDEEPEELTDEELATRCEVMCKGVTATAWSYIRRGLFERHKLTICTQLTLNILLALNKVNSEDVTYLVAGKQSLDPGNMGPLQAWLPEALWPRIKALEGMKAFQGLGDAMQNEEDDWHKWFDNAQCENAKIPGEFKDLSDFNRIILLRAMRGDRLSAALSGWISELEDMGKQFVSAPPFAMCDTFVETSPDTPVFFVLFPGVDPTGWVEDFGKTVGFTLDNGKFVNISMGQGQEGPAEAKMTSLAKEGGWIMLQNCHLMQSWVPQLERLFEICIEDAHPDFRLFLSAEPPPIASWKNMPESLMQACIKVANEAPADIQSNLRRAWANFSQERIEQSSKPTEMKSLLFALCWFHALVLGRRRFGQQGWSRAYSFNTGDLLICANVLEAYLEDNANTPFQDLRYIFGEIMYGGHITDAWDRTTCNTYLSVLVIPELFEGLQLGPGFNSPNAEEFDYAAYANFIEEGMPAESPPQFGLHANAEIGFLTVAAEDLFKTIQSLSGGSGDGGGAGSGAAAVMNDLLERLPEPFELIGLKERAAPLQITETGPYVTDALQECTYMNVLTNEMRRSLVELGKGLKGQLNMSQTMEDLVTALAKNEVPGRNPWSLASWEKLAWFSKKGLISWFLDMVKRIDQLVMWTEELVRPFSIWISGLFNATAYLTAVKQVTARATKMALDEMSVLTYVTTLYTPEEALEHPKDGAFVHGFFMEGARWPMGDEVADCAEKVPPVDRDGVQCAGHIVDSKLKELLPAMPLVYIKAVKTQPTWESTSVGVVHNDPTIYDCPIYITTFRGPTYVALATLETADPCSKWVLAGVALVFQEDT